MCCVATQELIEKGLVAGALDAQSHLLNLHVHASRLAHTSPREPVLQPYRGAAALRAHAVGSAVPALRAHL